MRISICRTSNLAWIYSQVCLEIYKARPARILHSNLGNRFNLRISSDQTGIIHHISKDIAVLSRPVSYLGLGVTSIRTLPKPLLSLAAPIRQLNINAALRNLGLATVFYLNIELVIKAQPLTNPAR